MSSPAPTHQCRNRASGGTENAPFLGTLPAYLLLSGLVFLISGCSSSRSHSSESVPLPPSALAIGNECSALGGSTGGSSEKAQVYRCKDVASDGSEKAPFFVTVLRDCSISEKFSHRATTRQLLVGFTHLKVLNQEPIELGAEKVLRSVVSGILDVDPVFISTFTLRRGSCVTDLVMWKQSEEAKDAIIGTLGNDSVAQRFAEATTELAQRFGDQELFPDLEIKKAPSSEMTTSGRMITGNSTDLPHKVHHAELPTG